MGVGCRGETQKELAYWSHLEWSSDKDQEPKALWATRDRAALLGSAQSPCLGLESRRWTQKQPLAWASVHHGGGGRAWTSCLGQRKPPKTGGATRSSSGTCQTAGKSPSHWPPSPSPQDQPRCCQVLGHRRLTSTMALGRKHKALKTLHLQVLMEPKDPKNSPLVSYNTRRWQSQLVTTPVWLWLLWNRTQSCAAV